MLEREREREIVCLFSINALLSTTTSNENSWPDSDALASFIARLAHFQVNVQFDSSS